MGQLRDLTGGPRVLPIDVTWAPVYEVLTAAWAMIDKEQSAAHDGGLEMRDHVMGRLDPSAQARFERFGAVHGTVWLAAFGMAHDLGDDTGAEDFAQVILDDEAQLRRRILDMLPDDGSVPVAEAVATAEGLSAFLATVDQAKHASGVVETVEGWLRLEPGALAREVATILTDLGAALEDHIATFGEGLRRDCAGTAALALTMPPARVVELATKGIAYEPAPGIEALRLVPSAIVRPWSLMLEHDRVRTFVYPAGDEYLDADPDAPPAWLIKTYKALGDEKRLKILGRLGKGGATLGELSELIDAAKSTAHHHIGILRSAGLIRVEISENKDLTTYRLRTGVIPAAEHMLAQFLSGETS